MTALRLFLVLALCACALAGPIRLNTGGNYIQLIGWRGDSGNLVTGNTAKYAASDPVSGGGVWGPVYQSHRWAMSGNMRYKIPVPAGVYTVNLLFSETWKESGPGLRQFEVKVNGAAVRGVSPTDKKINGVLDVFAMTGGLQQPLYVQTRDVKSINGFITIDLKRIPGKNNPMVSGIFIDAPNADALLGAEGFPVLNPPPQPPAFTKASLKTFNGAKDYSVPLPTSVTYGPDGRLYLGSLKSKVWALSVSSDLRVTKWCWKSTIAKPPQPTYPRPVTGVAFDPSTNDLRLFFTTSTHHWQKNKNFTSFAQGWQNGKVQSVSMQGPDGCFKDDIADVVTGLPVSNHGHAPNAITFLPSGEMLIGIGGVTNGGIPGPELGGIPESPFSGAIISCPSSGTAIKYSNPGNPAQAKVVGGACKVYASGFRNTFGMALHTNGKLYATDNGPHKTDTAFSTDCNGGKKPSSTFMDRLHLVQPGKCHGHPNQNRKECVFRDPKCVKPLLDTLPASTNGIIEYRSNLFSGVLKGDLLMARFIAGEGEVSRVQLNGAGYLKANGFTERFWGASGLSIVEGPRGELVMPRLYPNTILVAKPVFKLPNKDTFVTSVMPRRGPAGGKTKVTITGTNFGSKPIIKFGGKLCTSVAVIDPFTVTCVTTAGAKNSQVKVDVQGISTTYVSASSEYWYF